MDLLLVKLLRSQVSGVLWLMLSLPPYRPLLRLSVTLSDSSLHTGCVVESLTVSSGLTVISGTAVDIFKSIIRVVLLLQ